MGQGGVGNRGEIVSAMKQFFQVINTWCPVVFGELWLFPLQSLGATWIHMVYTFARLQLNGEGALAVTSQDGFPPTAP